MKKNMSTPQEGQMPGDDELKKLRKREQRVLERLQEAQKARTKALERFQRAEARLQKRSTRLQRIEGRLTLLRQQLEPSPQQINPENTESQSTSQTQSSPDLANHTTPALVSEDAPIATPAISETITPTSEDAAVVTPTGETEAAESEDVPVTSSSTGENAHPEIEDAPLATAINSEDARAAAEATEENVRLAAERASEIAARDTNETAFQEANDGQQPGEMAEVSQESASPAIPVEITLIEEEEELISAGTAETIAHITAERAAKAEVIAEISSKQTEEARRYVQDAEQALAAVRAAMSNGTLYGEEAQEALWRAEHAITRAQAFLADAEANEEQAVKAAMNAEADAEVAEGMAFASADHVALLTSANEPQNGDEADATTKMSVIQPQEQA